MCTDYYAESIIDEGPPEEYYEQFRQKYDLYISDLWINEPFKTEIPYIAKNNYIPLLHEAIKFQRVTADTEEVDVTRALRIALRLIGLSHKIKSEKYTVEKLVINRFLIYGFVSSLNREDNSILGFYFSKYFTFNSVSDRVPLVVLMKERPDLLFTDKVVQLSIALLRELYYVEPADIAKQAKETLLKCGLNAFIPQRITLQRSKYRALHVFKFWPERLSLVLRTYELILKEKYNVPGKSKKYYIDEAYKEIYRKPVSNSLKFTGEQDKDSKSIVLKFISVEFEAPFEGLKKRYYSNRKKEKYLTKAALLQTSKLIERNKPHLCKYLKIAIESFSS